MVCCQRNAENRFLIKPLGTLLLTALALLILGAGSAFAADGETYEWLGVERLNKADAALNDLKTEYPAVREYRSGHLIGRLYGTKFSFGATPQASAEAFRTKHADVFGVSADELVAGKKNDPRVLTQPVMYDQATGTYKFTLVYYHQVRDGMLVHDAELRLLVKNEASNPVVLAVSSLRDLGAFSPSLSKADQISQQAVQAAIADEPLLSKFSDQEAIVWAGINQDMVAPVTAVKFTGAAVDEPFKFEFIVDAETGEIISKQNLLHDIDIVGTVRGMASQGLASEQCTEEEASPLPYIGVNVAGGATFYTDADGNFSILNPGSSDVSVESDLKGEWYEVFNWFGADVNLSTAVTPPGPVNFMHNEGNTDELVRSQVNAYYQANLQRDFIVQYNPSYPTINDGAFPIYVNRTDGYCPGNAWYDPVDESINFCQSGDGHPNTAWSSVLHHEFGHHMVNVAGSGQGQYGEGMSDCMAMLIADDPRLGLGFFGSCNVSLRSALNDYQYPCSGGIHDCGQLLSACVWDTRNALIANYPDTYLDILSVLTINSILLHTGTEITPQITIDFLTLDDDDGDLDNGTPHWNEICSGFSPHNMPCPELRPIVFAYPNGRPEFLLPDTQMTVRVEVQSNSVSPVATSGQAYYSVDGGPLTAATMTEVSPNLYDITMPTLLCDMSLTWYMQAEAEGFGLVSDPLTAPTEMFSAIAATSSTVALDDNFETNQGWTVGGVVTDGAWTRGVPAGGGDRGDPASDFDGSGACYLTDNVDGNSDVDGGTTILYSPLLDLSATGDALISYARWYSNTSGSAPGADQMDIYITDNDGGSWTLVETVGPTEQNAGGWFTNSFFVSDYVSLTAQVKMRFDASDLGEGSVVEAGVDAFKVTEIDCNSTNLAITTFDLPDWTVDMPYSVQLTSINGTGQLSFIDLFDDLDGTGLSLSVDGVLSGTPNSAGVIDFTAEVTDELPSTDQQALSLTINPPVSVSDATLPAWTRGQTYPVTQLFATGGTGSMTWTDFDGGLNGSGLQVTTDGRLQGVLGAAGTYTFMAQAVDVAGSADQKEMTVTVNPSVSILTAMVPGGRVDEAFSFQLEADGGTGTVNWSDENGDLAGTGLTLSSAGLISGVTTTEQEISFTARAADTAGSSDLEAYTFLMNAGCCAGTSVGNVDGSPDLMVSIGDLTVLVDALFISLVAPDCLEEADIDLSGQPDPTATDITLGDLTALVDYLFISLSGLASCP